MRPSVVVLVAEAVEEGLQLGGRGWLDRLGAQPLLHGLLEAFDLAAGGGVVGVGVLLHHVQAAQFDFEAGAPAAAAGESGGVDHPVVGQRGGRNAVLGNGFAEAAEHDRAGDPGMRGHVQRVAGAVVEPAEDLHVDRAARRGR